MIIIILSEFHKGNMLEKIGILEEKIKSLRSQLVQIKGKITRKSKF
jgi:hypothetical protein